MSDETHSVSEIKHFFGELYFPEKISPGSNMNDSISEIRPHMLIGSMGSGLMKLNL